MRCRPRFRAKEAHHLHIAPLSGLSSRPSCRSHFFHLCWPRCRAKDAPPPQHAPRAAYIKAVKPFSCSAWMLAPFSNKSRTTSTWPAQSSLHQGRPAEDIFLGVMLAPFSSKRRTTLHIAPHQRPSIKAVPEVILSVDVGAVFQQEPHHLCIAPLSRSTLRPSCRYYFGRGCRCRFRARTAPPPHRPPEPHTSKPSCRYYLRAWRSVPFSSKSRTTSASPPRAAYIKTVGRRHLVRLYWPRFPARSAPSPHRPL